MSGRRARARSGQALVEFLAAAGTLAALFVGTALVARLHDLQWATIAASRYAAFDRALRDERSDAVQLERQLRARFFEPALAIRAAEGRRDDEQWQRLDPNWSDLAPAAVRLVTRPADVRLRLAEDPAPGASAALAANVAGLADGAARLNGGRFDVERRGFHSARIEVGVARIASAPRPLSDLALTLREETRVLGGGWDSDGPDEVATRTRAFVPGARLQALRPIVDAFRWALRLFEPSIDQLCLGRIDPELVPVDRLGVPGSAERGTWVAPC